MSNVIRQLQAYWVPTPLQLMTLLAPMKVVLYSGGRGSGKSDVLIAKAFQSALTYGRNFHGVILRPNYDNFAELRGRVDTWLYDLKLGKRKGPPLGENIIRLTNGALIRMMALEKDEQLSKYKGNEINFFGFDECTEFPNFSGKVEYLLGSMRSTKGVPSQIFGTSNPDGISHYDVKKYFYIGQVPFGTPIDRDPNTGRKIVSRVAINSRLLDNPHLVKNDPEYVETIRSTKDPLLRAAWVYGDWNLPQLNPFPLNKDHHVIKPHQVPKTAHIIMTMDYGFGAPMPVLYGYADHNGNLVIFSELYLADTKDGDLNKGLRLNDIEIVKAIIEHEKALGIHDRVRYRIGGHDMNNSHPDYSHVRDTAQVQPSKMTFAEHGVYISTSKPDKNTKFRAVRTRLHLEFTNNGKLVEPPSLMIFDTCKYLIEILPGLVGDSTNPELLAKGQPDHIADALALMCNTSLMSDPGVIQGKAQSTVIIENKTEGRPLNYNERMPTATEQELEDAMEEVEWEEGDWDLFDDF